MFLLDKRKITVVILNKAKLINLVCNIVEISLKLSRLRQSIVIILFLTSFSFIFFFENQITKKVF